MITFVTSHYNEAKPLIEHFKLKKDLQHKIFQVFKSDEVQLIISGIGKVRSAIAVTYLSALNRPESGDYVVNVGVCAAPVKFPIGSFLIGNYIKDTANNRRYIPDILFHHSFTESAIETFDSVQQENLSTVVDMEASGFMDAASLFYSPDQIAVVKVVSDHGDDINTEKEFINGLIEENLHKIILFLSCIVSPINLEERSVNQLNLLCAANSEQIKQIKDGLKSKNISAKKYLSDNYNIQDDEDRSSFSSSELIAGIFV